MMITTLNEFFWKLVVAKLCVMVIYTPPTQNIDPFQPNGYNGSSFLYTLKTLENLSFSEVFRRSGNRIVSKNGFSREENLFQVNNINIL